MAARAVFRFSIQPFGVRAEVIPYVVELQE